MLCSIWRAALDFVLCSQICTINKRFNQPHLVDKFGFNVICQQLYKCPDSKSTIRRLVMSNSTRRLTDLFGEVEV